MVKKIPNKRRRRVKNLNRTHKVIWEEQKVFREAKRVSNRSYKSV